MRYSSFSNRIKDSLKTSYVGRWFSDHARNVLGITDQQKQIDGLYYFLNELHPCNEYPLTRNTDLRNLQRCLTVLLELFATLCERHHLRWWLHGGNLLGAIRHRGFIPWDDDLDVAMPRKDYNQVMPLMKKELSEYGISVQWGGYYDDYGKLARLAIAYDVLKTGIWMDIFPVDCVHSPHGYERTKELINIDIQKYKRYYERVEKREKTREILKEKHKFFKNVSEGTNRIMFLNPEFPHSFYVIVPYGAIFPLKSMIFEDIACFIPRTEQYLKELYGNFRLYPNMGIEFHKDLDGIAASERAGLSGTDMVAVEKDLRDILERVKSEEECR